MFWERVQDVGRPVYLHPTNVFQLPQNYQDHPELVGALWGWLPETATHVLRMVFSGLFDRYPGVQIIIGHGGEALPYPSVVRDGAFHADLPGVAAIPTTLPDGPAVALVRPDEVELSPGMGDGRVRSVQQRVGGSRVFVDLGGTALDVTVRRGSPDVAVDDACGIGIGLARLLPLARPEDGQP